MDEIKVIVNGAEYSEDQFEKDKIRMLDTYRKKDSKYMGSIKCRDIDCRDCPLCLSPCDGTRNNYYGIIKGVFLWAYKHPIVTNVTNKDKLKELFGIWIEPTIVIGSEDKDGDENPLNFEFLFMKNGDHTVLAQFKEKNDTFWKWLNEEYKEPKGESKND